MTRKMMTPALSNVFPSFCLDTLEDVRSVPPIIQIIKAAVAGSWISWMKRLRRETAVALLERILVLLNSQRHPTETRTQGDHSHQPNNRNISQHLLNLTLLTQRFRRTSGCLIDTAHPQCQLLSSPRSQTKQLTSSSTTPPSRPISRKYQSNQESRTISDQ